MWRLTAEIPILFVLSKGEVAPKLSFAPSQAQMTAFRSVSETWPHGEAHHCGPPPIADLSAFRSPFPSLMYIITWICVDDAPRNPASHFLLSLMWKTWVHFSSSTSPHSPTSADHMLHLVLYRLLGQKLFCRNARLSLYSESTVAYRCPLTLMFPPQLPSSTSERWLDSLPFYFILVCPNLDLTSSPTRINQDTQVVLYSLGNFI